VAVIAFFLGYLSAARQADARARQDNARLVAAVAGLPTAASVTTYLRTKGGDIAIGPITNANGKSQTQGVIIRPGSLKFGKPEFSTDGAALVPIQQ
jgi:hypothetical protein